LHSHHQQTLGNDYVPIIVFKHQEDILKYLDKSGTLVRLQEAANKYKKYKERLQKDGEHRLPFLFLLEIDIVLLSEISGK
jgi:galactose-1-phosphate uridylyltransferase